MDNGFYSANCIRGEFVRAVGIPESHLDTKADVLAGAIDEIRASVIVANPFPIPASPFKIAMTDVAADHLTFDDSRGRPTLRVLSIERILGIYIAQRTGLATYIPCSIPAVTRLQCSRLFHLVPRASQFTCFAFRAR